MSPTRFRATANAMASAYPLAAPPRSPVRILHAPHSYAPVRGGAEEYTRRLSVGLAERGHEVAVATIDADTPEAFYGFDYEELHAPDETIDGVAIRRIPIGSPVYRKLLRPAARRLGMDPGLGWGAHHLNRAIGRWAEELGRFIDQFRPDVVMTLPHLFPNVAAVIEHKRAEGPYRLVVAPLLHEDDPYWRVEPMADALSTADAVLAMTDHEAGRLVSAYGVPESSVTITGGGADVVPNASAGNRSSSVLYVGRLTRKKGLPLLVEAMEHVWAHQPSVTLTLAGSGEWVPPPDRRIQVVPSPSDDAKHDLLARASCLVLPSTIESLGLVVLEAWAHGTPPVVLDAPALREIVTDGEDGLVVPPADAAELAGAILRMLSGATDDLGAAGLRRVREEHRWDSVIDRVTEAYHPTDSH